MLCAYYLPVICLYHSLHGVICVQSWVASCLTSYVTTKILIVVMVTFSAWLFSVLPYMGEVCSCGQWKSEKSSGWRLCVHACVWACLATAARLSIYNALHCFYSHYMYLHPLVDCVLAQQHATACLGVTFWILLATIVELKINTTKPGYISLTWHCFSATMLYMLVYPSLILA